MARVLIHDVYVYIHSYISTSVSVCVAEKRFCRTTQQPEPSAPDPPAQSPADPRGAPPPGSLGRRHHAAADPQPLCTELGFSPEASVAGNVTALVASF